MNNTRVLERRAGLAIAQFIKSTQTRNLSTSRMIGIDALRPSFRHVPSRAIRRPNALPRCPKSQNAGKSRFNSTNSKPTTPDPTPNLGSPEPAPSLSQRLRKLSREYGWTAVGVYFALSALDFPFCFLAVRALGTDRIGRWEHNVVTWVKSIVAVPFPGLVKDTGEHSSDSVEAIEASVREGTAALDDQLIQAQKSDASK